MVFLCSLATGCMAPIGHSYPEDDAKPDAGTSDGGNSAGCETKDTDVVIASTADFDKLPTGCWNAGAKLQIRGGSITSVEKLGDLRKVQHLELDGTALPTFNSKAAIDVTGDIVIANNAQLTSIDNIKPLDTVASIRVQANNALTNLGGLANAKRVTGLVQISNNPQLTSLVLTATNLDGGLTIQTNAKLQSPTLDNVTSLGNYTVLDNAALTSIGGLAKLTTLNGNLLVENNDQLVTLSPTIGTSLQVSGFIRVLGNQRLTSLGNLSRARSVTGFAEFGLNPSLHYHVVYEYRCCVQAGSTYIDNSGPSCSNNNTPHCGSNCPYL